MNSSWQTGAKTMKACFFFPRINLHACIIYTVWRAWHGMAPTFMWFYVYVYSLCTFLCIKYMYWYMMHNHKTICVNLAECEHALFMVWLVRGGFCNGFSELQQLFCHWHQHSIGPHVLISFAVFFWLFCITPQELNDVHDVHPILLLSQVDEARTWSLKTLKWGVMLIWPF